MTLLSGSAFSGARTASRSSKGAAAPAAFRSLLAAAGRDWRGRGLRIHLPDGGVASIQGSGEAQDAVIVLHDLNTLRRVLAAGDIGFAEGFVEGEWDTPDLSRLLEALGGNWERLRRLTTGSLLARLGNRLLSGLNRNTRSGAKRNIHAHYDLGNDFYGAWLDEGMTYSSGLYRTAEEPIEAAQRRKYAALAKSIGLQPGHSVLEIGCGWGGFAEFAAAEVGARVVGLTISRAQHDFARERMHRQGLSEQADIQFLDYREARGSYDRVVSIEMFEAVGEAYWPTYFEVVHDRLRPGGRAGLQVITIRDDLFDSYRRRIDFIQKYVFPGGMLPGESRLRAEVERAGLRWSEPYRFGPDYGRTLKDWAERFEAAWPRLADQGFDDRFRRLWRFYLAYCEAGFRAGRTDVVHLALDRA